MEFFLFLPQMRLSFDQLVERARAAEAAGFGGIMGMDHLAPPMAEDQPMYDAMVTNAWIAAHTERIAVGSLVLCDAFRHPAVLAREVASIDHASGGRYELGIGWGSVPTEFPVFGVGSTEPRDRVQRLRETLDVVTALWAGETVDYDGEFHQMSGARQAPTPLGKIPIVIGGIGPKTLALVRDYADWWNVHTGALDNLAALQSQVGDARVSIQQMVAHIPDEADRASITEVAMRRFGQSGPVVGTGPELVDHFGRLAAQGVERVYAWFCDFAPPDTLAGFGAEVVDPLRHA
ncbi:MAG: LLM class flavin-dependent oxidoreductase [Acidimicrobiia bacterium]|jgi:alkanesulfonate monooxygenase SsuD/methylene tetrahydromethanopterin reductase-like flavin-dependent oxidoreductase (luciferase family)